jgi:brefeldin A-inhibited guanine nucleotide-exchange protein
LQQLVTSVFVRVVKTDRDEQLVKTPDNFPSKNHRDAFLVMRSICKLSMRNPPDPNTGMVSHVGISTSGSNDMWDGNKDSLAKSGRGEGQPEPEERAHEQQAHLVSTGAIHPALESKILALELLLYVLRNTEFSRGFIQRSGPQFHAAIRNYLCVSLLKNCTSGNTQVVHLSLHIFVPLVRSFRTVLKNEIEAFVTNVFFVILDSKNSPVEHKSIVVQTFDEICSDPATLAEIFLNYDCDLSAVDLFHRIVNTLSRVSRTGVQEPKSGGMSFMGGQSAARLEKFRIENRELRLDAMKALRQVLASLHASIVEPMPKEIVSPPSTPKQEASAEDSLETTGAPATTESPAGNGQQNLVELYGAKKKRRAEEAEVILRFNQKPSAGLKYAAKCGHVDGEDPLDVARYLLKNKDAFEKTMIGECMGREAEYQNGFNLKVLHEYVRLLDFSGLSFDEAIRYFLSGFRLPGEAQKVR